MEKELKQSYDPTASSNITAIKAITDAIIGTIITSRVIKSATLTTPTPISLFTVTGDVAIKIIGIVKETALTSDAITASVGVEGDTAKLIALVADATALQINEIWHDATPDATIELSSVWVEWLISGGQNIILTTTGTFTAGIIDFYAYWYPLSADGNVVAA
jgi:hypothetical protein